MKGPEELGEGLPDIGSFAFDVRAKTAANFRDENSTLIEETLSELNRLYATVIFCVILGCDISSSPRFNAFALFLRSLESLVSALHLASHRQAIEALTVMRLSLESAAAAADICMNYDAFVNYENSKYNSTDSTKFAKKIVPIYGKLWGMISNVAVHVNLLHGPTREPSGEDNGMDAAIKVFVAEKKAPSGQDERLLTLISLVSNINLRLFEEVLFKKGMIDGSWLRVPGTAYAYVDPTDKLIAKYYDRFVELPEIY